MQFNLGVLSHYSYMLISGGQALVVDPDRDVFAYLALAKKENLKIKGVFLTHNHADFVAGHLELAKAAGCPIYASAKSGDQFAHQSLKEGSKIEVGDAVVKILETPGHTPDGLCGLVAPKKQPDKPNLILTGDVLFIGSVGRPDLMGGTASAASLASQSYDTWTRKLSKLPDNLNIFPAHGAGSLCGAHLSDEPTSTLGAQKIANPYVKHKTRGGYIAAVLEGLPEAPQYFKHNAALNQKGPELINWEATPVQKKPDQALTNPSRFYVVDLRNAKEYAAGHIPNSVNIAVRGRLETWVGIMVPWGSNLVLCGDPKDLKEAVYRLHRVGYRAEIITPEAWKKAGLPLAKNEMISPRDLYAQMQTPDSPVVVDVRLPTEWMGLRIGTVVNLPLNHLAELAPAKLDPEQRAVMVCNSAFRSSLAVGIMERLNFKKVASLDGGSEAWIAAGLPTFGPEARPAAAMAPAASPTPTPAPAPKRDIKLPERLSPAALKRLILDLPNSFELVDIRPPEAFTDYHLPGSRNADIDDVMKNPAYLSGSVPLILVDRDGSLAMAVGGILSQKTARPIRVLYGGLDAYWTELELKGAVRETPISGAGPTGVQPPPPATPPGGPTPTPTPPPAPPKKKSAGC
ncbi:MAG: MBL fold metallo-hydrolase [Proteobacteria bacterium]|nr:MBL fold metallo-hydrolase [Pseudomonadota bacterium]MBU4356613.1 MBL fold metallo-hydrolase [Pseudomonadota bacterium]